MTRLLFFDDTQLLEKWGLERRLGQPVPVPEATFQVPGIDLGFAYPTVFPNREAGGWRMLYQALTGLERGKGPVHFVPSVVDSSDGIHWRIPDLEASVPLPDRLLPNQVGAAPLNRFGEWGPCYYDDRAQDPRQRVKGFVCKGHGPGTGKKDSWIVTSPDGLTWNDPGGVLWHPYGSDPAVCAFWNRYRDSYVLSIRPKNGDRRIALMETPDWKEFSKVELALSPDGLDPDLAELYGMPAFPYGNLFIGLLWVYRTPPRTSQHGKFLGGRIDCQLAYSYDGWHFQRGPREPLAGQCRSRPDRGGVHPALQPDCDRERDPLLLLRHRPGACHLRRALPPTVGHPDAPPAAGWIRLPGSRFRTGRAEDPRPAGSRGPTQLQRAGARRPTPGGSHRRRRQSHPRLRPGGLPALQRRQHRLGSPMERRRPFR